MHHKIDMYGFGGVERKPFIKISTSSFESLGEIKSRHRLLHKDW